MNSRNIVEKHGKSAQGDLRSEERRIVLDNSMTDKVKEVLVFNGPDLLKLFLSYITNASKQVIDTVQPKDPSLFSCSAMVAKGLTQLLLAAPECSKIARA